MSTDFPVATNWFLDDDVNLYDSLACLLEDEVKQEEDDSISDLESCVPNTKDGKGKAEKGSKGAKKRKFNPDSDIIATATDETLKQLDLDPNSKEGKMKRRQIRNRLSAQFHRDRKNAHMQTLEEQLAGKDMEIASLKSQVTALLAENEYLRNLNPGVLVPGRQRNHAVSLSSYPEGTNSLIHTDNEDADSTSQNFLNFLHPGQSAGVSSGSSTCSTSGTVSSNGSPYHVAVEATLPGIYQAGLPNQLSALPPQQLSTQPARRGNVVTLVSPNGGVRQTGISNGAGMLQVPSGLARPLSIITMVCMVSIMLLGGSQSPNLGAVTFKYTPYQASQRAQYVQLLSGGSGKVPAQLTVGTEVLALMHTEAGAHNVETRGDAEVAEAATHGRRLSEEDSSDEDSESSHTAKRPRSVEDSSERVGRERSNSLYDPALMTPEEEAAASKAIDTLNLESIAPLAMLPSPAQGSNVSVRHNHLRRSHAEMEAPPPPAQRARSRQVIFSSGVVSRGLVEDSVVYAPPRRSVFGGERGENGTVGDGVQEGEFPAEGMYHSQEYQWPASQAFDYAVQSYSKVVLTEGQALLDPSLALHKNPFAWTRAMFQHSGAERSYASEGAAERGNAARVRRVNEREPTITERAEDFADADAMDVPEEVTGAVVPAAVRLPLAPVRALPDVAEHPSHAVVPKSLLQLAPVKSEFPNLPAVIHQNQFDGYDSEVPTERSVLNKLLAESNFMTLKLPASSIRVGKNWDESRSGTVESIMEVFNISAPADGHYRVSPTAEASVEINCIILGAKLVLSETSTA